MGQVSRKLRRATNGYEHWCPGCNGMHVLPDGWSFDGNVESPTFNPSFHHYTEKPAPWICHYILAAGELRFCSDCSHALAGKIVELPDLPVVFGDEPLASWRLGGSTLEGEA